MKKQHGYSLIEIMVVVAIIAVLAAIAVPNYNRFVAKARIGQATGALSSIYSAEKMFFSEHAFYTYCLYQAGYRPDPGGERFYTVGFYNGIDDGCGVGSCWRDARRNGQPCSPASIPFGQATRNDATFGANRWANPALTGSAPPENYNAGRTSFNAVAFGSVSSSSRILDVWQINQTGQRTNVRNGL